MPVVKKTRKKTEKKPGPQSIKGILLLLKKQNLSAAEEWYVLRLSEVYAEIAEGKSPKVKLEILQELRDFILPSGERIPSAELYDPALGGLPPSMMYDGERVRSRTGTE